MYPVNLDIRDKLCVVVGGGAVGYRKIKNLLDYGARVRLISPIVCSKLESLVRAGKLGLLSKKYEYGDLAGAFLVYAASDSSEVQQQVAEEAKERGVFLNSATDPGKSDFHLPAIIRRGDFQLAISTGGGSPAFSRYIKHQLEEDFGHEYEYAVGLLGIIRRSILVHSEHSDHNKIVFRSLVSSNMLNLIKIGDLAGLTVSLQEILPTYLDVKKIMVEFESLMFESGC
ncbi:MAG: bifunctional precorrin-2 dehydrogenase/sirohydrochlorin ferrochelatase [Desulfotalea sp.]